MVLSSTFVLFQLRGAFTTGRDDLQLTERNNLYSIKLARILALESDAIRSYILTRDSAAFNTYLEQRREFETVFDTLANTTARIEIRSLLSAVDAYHTAFNERSATIIWNASLDTSQNPSRQLAETIALQ
ncbi:MAG: hypothetical protein EPO24_00155, partial [Bacteroidetes bacterium]